MSFRPQRDQPLPKGLVHGLTSIMFESALVPAKPPEPPAKSKSDAQQSPSVEYIKRKDEPEAN